MKVVLRFLWLMYFLQGIPYGFQTTYLPVFLRSHALPLSLISLTRLLSLPWILKPLWAPLIDGLGRKTSWIVLSLVGMASLYLCASFIILNRWIPTMGVVACLNILASTHDIAVDSIIVDLLPTDHIGIGNIAQVVGYKSGLLVGGGIFGWLSSTVPWQRLFFLLFLAYLGSAVLVISPVFSKLTKARPTLATNDDSISKGEEGRESEGSKREQGARKRRNQTSNKPEVRTKSNNAHRRSLLRIYFAIYREKYQQILQSPGTKWTIVYVLTYKLGEQGIVAIFPMFLIDQGVSVSQTTTLAGVWCQAFSIAGSFFGGIIVSPQKRNNLTTILTSLSSIRLLVAALLTWCSSWKALESTWIAIVCFDCVLHFISGAITTVAFTLMVRCSQRCTTRISATHYSTLASFEVLGKLTMTSISGTIAEKIGYNKFFALCCLVLVLNLIVLRIPNRLTDNEVTHCD